MEIIGFMDSAILEVLIFDPVFELLMRNRRFKGLYGGFALKRVKNRHKISSSVLHVIGRNFFVI
jgi:hypothetical protein